MAIYTLVLNLILVFLLDFIPERHSSSVICLLNSQQNSPTAVMTVLNQLPFSSCFQLVLTSTKPGEFWKLSSYYVTAFSAVDTHKPHLSTISAFFGHALV